MSNLARLVVTTVAFALGAPGCTVQDSITSDLGLEESGDCTRTQGFWKNHPEVWPVSSVSLGSVSYTKAELLAIFGQPVQGNGLVALAHQLIAAKLNVAAGADDSVIVDAIVDADALIGDRVVPPVGSGHLPTAQTSGLNGELDGFNNSDGACAEAPPPPACGDGSVDDGEQCDDGNTANGDGCSATCTTETPPGPVCGNGVVETGEECDDGNATNGDGCTSACVLEPPVPPEPVCGDGVVQGDEQCDDGNTSNGDGCSDSCVCELDASDVRVEVNAFTAGD